MTTHSRFRARRTLYPWLFLIIAHFDPAQADELIKPTEVRKIYGDGKHNAFTALRRFKGELFLAFRTAEGHNSGVGDVLILRSKDGKEWQPAHKLDVAKDDRDPQFLVTDKRLFCYWPAIDGQVMSSWLTYTDDGKDWSKPEKVYEPQYILWKPFAHAGIFYAAAHKKDDANKGKTREVHFIQSADGIKWEKVSTIRAGNWESETTLYMDDKHHATAFLRQKYGNPQAQILEADAPYTTWAARPADVPHFSGHSVHTFKGVTYLLTRTTGPGKTTGTMIYTFANNKLTPYCALPAGGDCAYLEAVEEGANMLVSYYSSHEDAANIYLATVPLR